MKPSDVVFTSSTSSVLLYDGEAFWHQTNPNELRRVLTNPEHGAVADVHLPVILPPGNDNVGTDVRKDPGVRGHG